MPLDETNERTEYRTGKFRDASHDCAILQTVASPGLRLPPRGRTATASRHVENGPRTDRRSSCNKIRYPSGCRLRFAAIGNSTGDIHLPGAGDKRVRLYGRTLRQISRGRGVCPHLFAFLKRQVRGRHRAHNSQLFATAEDDEAEGMSVLDSV